MSEMGDLPSEPPKIDFQPLRSVEDKYGGVQLKIHLLTPTKALYWSTWLTKLLGEPIAKMGLSAPANTATPAEKERASMEGFSSLVKLVCDRISEDQVDRFVKAMIATALVMNEKGAYHAIAFETFFQGRLGLLLKVTRVVMEVQFEDFFEEIGQMFSAKAEAATP